MLDAIRNFYRFAAPRCRELPSRAAEGFLRLRDVCAKQWSLVKHYPRGHAYAVAGLAAGILVLAALPSESSSAGPVLRTISVSAGGPATGLNEITVATSPVKDLRGATSANPKSFDLPGSQHGSQQGSQHSFQQIPDTASEPAEQPAGAATHWQHFEIAAGDSLSSLFAKAGLTDSELFTLLASSPEAKILNRVYPGYKLDFNIPDGSLEQLRVSKNPLESTLFTRVTDGYAVEQIVREPEIRRSFKVGTISDSLFLAGQREQIPATTIMEMANIFGGVIDFILDPRRGDQFSILYEEKYLDGEFIGHGDILASRFVNQGKVFTAVRYIDPDGEKGYYNPEGESMRKAFLRSPMDVFRISSNFNPRRRHPVLNTIRAHKGTDYAAPTGTPIRATSDGRVSFAGCNGSFGNLVVIKHSGGFETKYAHLNRFAGYKKGARVRQGDIIGYVGSTGSATGPHLHYEFLVNGVHQNPRTILDKLPKARSVEPAQLPVFKSQTAGLIQQFETLASRKTDAPLVSLAR